LPKDAVWLFINLQAFFPEVRVAAHEQGMVTLSCLSEFSVCGGEISSISSHQMSLSSLCAVLVTNNYIFQYMY
jgi:hypothetical protein